MMKMIKRLHRTPKKNILGTDTFTVYDRVVSYGVCNYDKYSTNYIAIVLNLNLVELDNNIIMKKLQSSFFSHASDKNTKKEQKEWNEIF